MDKLRYPNHDYGDTAQEYDVVPNFRFTTLHYGERMRWTDHTMTVIPSSQVLKVLRAIRDRECSVDKAIDVITNTMA